MYVFCGCSDRLKPVQLKCQETIRTKNANYEDVVIAMNASLTHWLHVLLQTLESID